MFLPELMLIILSGSYPVSSLNNCGLFKNPPVAMTTALVDIASSAPLASLLITNPDTFPSPSFKIFCAETETSISQPAFFTEGIMFFEFVLYLVLLVSAKLPYLSLIY